MSNLIFPDNPELNLKGSDSLCATCRKHLCTSRSKLGNKDTCPSWDEPTESVRGSVSRFPAAPTGWRTFRTAARTNSCSNSCLRCEFFCPSETHSSEETLSKNPPKRTERDEPAGGVRGRIPPRRSWCCSKNGTFLPKLVMLQHPIRRNNATHPGTMITTQTASDGEQAGLFVHQTS